jgi:trimeric autotransporter adhesin
MPTVTKSTTIRSPLFIVTFLLLALAGCDQSSTHVVGTISEQGELRIDPTEVTLDNGESLDLGLQRYYPDGRTSPASGQVTWSSSSPAVATVSTTGRVTARLPGQVTIRAQTSRETASAVINILPTNGDLRLQVAEEIDIEVGANEKASVGAQVVDVSGKPIPGVHVDFRMGDAEEVLRQTTGGDGFTHFEFEVGTEAGELEIEVSSPGFSSDAAEVTEGAEISASQGGGALRRVIKVNVRPSTPSKVYVIPEKMSLEVDSWDAFVVKVVDNWGNPIDDLTFEWSLQRPEIAEIRSNGSVRGDASGSSGVFVVATDASGRSASGEAGLEVFPGEGSEAKSLSIQGGQGQTGVVGEQLASPLTVRALDSAGDGVPGITVSWSVVEGSGALTPSTSTTDSEGNASVEMTLGTSAGEVVVAAKAAGVPVRTFELRARAGVAATVTLEPGSLALEPGGTHRITARASDAHGNEISGRDFAWTSSDPEVAVVNSEGRVTARTFGVVTVAASIDGATGTSEVEVGGASEPTSLHIARSSLDLTALGEEAHLEVTARNADGAVVEVPSSLTWTSSDSSIASVNSTGRVVANAVGTAVVAVAAACCTGDSVMIRVTQEVASVEVSPSEGHLSIGDQLQFEARGYDSRGNPVGDLEVAWESLNSTIATVRADGVVTAEGGGQVQIRATSDSRSGSASITVESDDEGGSDGGDSDGGGDSDPTPENPATVDDLAVVSATENTMTLRFTEVSDGHGGAADYQIRYRASSTFGNWGTAGVVENGTCGVPVEGNSVGSPRECVVEGLTPGTNYTFRLVSRRTIQGGWVYGGLSNIVGGTTESASNGGGSDDDGDGGGGGSGEGESEPTSLHITTSGTQLTALGQSTQLNVTAEDEDGNTTDLPSSITWSSSDTNVATVNSSGRVIAQAVGTALISVAAACCTGDEVVIQVTQEVATVEVSPESASMAPGTTRQFDADVRDSNGYGISGANLSWSSTNSSVASVSSSGVVVANSAGSATIRATSSGWTGQASVSVSADDGSGSGDLLYPNEPSGWTIHREQEFRSLVDNTGATWGSRLISNGEFRLNIADPTNPAGTGVVAEVFFPEGMSDGTGPGRIATSMPRNEPEVFVGDYIKFSDNFSWHSLGIKILLFGLGDGGWITMGGGGHGFSEMRDTPAPNMSIGSRTGSAVSTGSDSLIRGEVFRFNVSDPPEYQRGEWMQREFHFRLNTPGTANGVVRMWIDGVLVTEYTDVDWGTNAPDWGEIQYGMTWGGGGSAVPHDQTIRIGHLRVSHPN